MAQATTEVSQVEDYLAGVKANDGVTISSNDKDHKLRVKFDKSSSTTRLRNRASVSHVVSQAEGLERCVSEMGHNANGEKDDIDMIVAQTFDDCSLWVQQKDYGQPTVKSDGRTAAARTEQQPGI